MEVTRIHIEGIVKGLGLTSSPRLKPGDSLHGPDSKGTSGLWERG